MNLVCSIIFIITAIVVTIYDYKYQKIPLWIIIINYMSLSLLIHPLFIIGILLILLCYKLDIAIDTIYLIVIGYLILIGNSVISIISIIILLVSIFISKRKYISYMIPIEIACIIELFFKEVITQWLVHF